MENFWQQLEKPIFALAPMEAVTDCAFREMFATYSVPADSREQTSRNNFVMFTEFINVDGLLHPEGYGKLKIYLAFTQNQHPIVAQIWGRNPDKFFESAKIIAQMGFNGIDINMGCPQEKEISQKTCAALIREPDLAKYIIERAKEGAGSLPVSVKTRIGYSGNELEKWLPVLLDAKPAAITIHGRSKKEKTKVPANWEAIKEAVKIRDAMFSVKSNPHPSPSPIGRGKDVGLLPLIIGNGDIKSRSEGLERIKETGCDGVMIGRGAFGNPWIFRKDNYQPTIKEKLSVMLEHTELYEKMYKGIKSFAPMKKNLKAYASGFDGATELRAKLMQINSAKEVKRIADDFLSNFA